MVISASTHNRTVSRNFKTTECVIGKLDRWTLTGKGSCCRICLCTGDGSCNR